MFSSPNKLCAPSLDSESLSLAKIPSGYGVCSIFRPGLQGFPAGEGAFGDCESSSHSGPARGGMVYGISVLKVDIWGARRIGRRLKIQ